MIGEHRLDRAKAMMEAKINPTAKIVEGVSHIPSINLSEDELKNDYSIAQRALLAQNRRIFDSGGIFPDRNIPEKESKDYEDIDLTEEDKRKLLKETLKNARKAKNTATKKKKKRKGKKK